MDNLKSVKSTTDFPKNNICKKQKRIKFVDRFRECITFDDGGTGGGEKSELKKEESGLPECNCRRFVN